jgi:hypothetical protein
MSIFCLLVSLVGFLLALLAPVEVLAGVIPPPPPAARGIKISREGQERYQGIASRGSRGI